MNWFKDNPLGMALAGISGVALLLALIMAVVWNLPVATETVELDAAGDNTGTTIVTAHEIAEMRELLVINQKPVFNQSRLPEISEEDTDEPEEDATIEVKGAPEVKLTGVIITPGMKIASLTPAKNDQESVMAHEGEALEGEYVGWQVETVNPRTVVLVSRDGQKLELELQVHDVAIKEPPKPVQKPVASAERAQAEPAVNEEGEPLSRAEQIRQRIAERREELRLEQEAQQAQSNAAQSERQKAERPPSYQEAIRSMMNSGSGNKGDNDEQKGNGNNGGRDG